MALKIDPRDPNFAWDKMKVSRNHLFYLCLAIGQVHQKVEEIKLIDPSSSKKDGHTRFVCISDTHNKTSK